MTLLLSQPIMGPSYLVRQIKLDILRYYEFVTKNYKMPSLHQYKHL